MAKLLLHDNPTRDRLTSGIYINENPDDPTGRIEIAFKAVLLSAPIEAKLHKAQKQRHLSKGPFANVLQEALQANIINEADAEIISKAEEARNNAIRVDDFAPEQLTENY